MSFATDLYALMLGDSSINAFITGAINYENLPDNFDLSKKWIVYHYRKSSQTDCLTIKNAYTTYELTVIPITQNTLDLVTITDDLIDYLNGKEQGSIVDVTFTGDGHSFDQEKNIYMNTLTFDVISE